jgi:2-oxoglutarate dehydrogenase complex dehydrogenase (E1) component-like enzyme
VRPGPLDELTRANPAYVASLWDDYRRDPRSVDERWALIFAGLEYGLATRQAALAPGAAAPGAGATPDVAEIVHSFRELGHLIADLDPLGGSPREHPLLSLRELGLTRPTSTARWTGRPSRPVPAARSARCWTRCARPTPARSP